MSFFPLIRMDMMSNLRFFDDKGKPCSYDQEPWLPDFDLDTLLIQQPSPSSPACISIEYSAYPKPFVAWYWRQVFINWEKRYEWYDEEIGPHRYRCTLKIKAFSNYDCGEYQIVATSRIGKKTFCLNIGPDHDVFTPKILQGPNTCYLGDGKYRLELSVWSPGREHIQWRKFKNGKEVRLDTVTKCAERDEERIRVLGHEMCKSIYQTCLIIDETTAKDRGTYRCEIYDANGMLHCDFPLSCDRGRPEGRPELYAEPKIVVTKSQNVIMAFCVRSPVEPTCTWRFPNGRMVAGHRIRNLKWGTYNQRAISTPDGAETLWEGKLDLPHWHHSLTGSYMCLVETIYGTLEIKYELQVNEENQPNDWYTATRSEWGK